MASGLDISELPVRHDKEAQRFVVGRDDEGPLAFVEYEVVGGSCGAGAVMDLFHTFTDPRGRGKFECSQGLAGKVVGAAFQYAQSSGNKILPTCSYVRDGFLRRHEEYRDLCVTDGQQPPVREVPPAENETGAIQDDNEDAASSSSSSSSADGEAQQGAHLFQLAYEQYARQLYDRADGAPESHDFPPVRPDVPARSLVRFASLLSRRARELSPTSTEDATTAADGAAASSTASPSWSNGSPAALRAEAAWIMGVAQSRFPESGWRLERADDTLEDLGRNGERPRVEQAKAIDEKRGEEVSATGPPAGSKRARHW